MEELRIIIQIEGFDRILYDEPAQWDDISLSVIDNGKCTLEACSRNVENEKQVASELTRRNEEIERFILAVEWAYGHELNRTSRQLIAPSFVDTSRIVEIEDNLSFGDQPHPSVRPNKVPALVPQVPLDAKRWIKTWVECTKLSEYVEEQLRRQYLIIEELWQELHDIFDAHEKKQKRNVKLIRDFVSHASCSNQDIVSLIENDLPSAIHIENGDKYASFERTIEHRNYISRFEVISRDIARKLVDCKMRQLGVVNNVK